MINRLKLEYQKDGKDLTLEVKIKPISPAVKLKVRAVEQQYSDEKAKKIQATLADIESLQRILSFTEMMTMSRSSQLMVQGKDPKEQISTMPEDVLGSLASITEKVENAVVDELDDWLNVMICKEIIDTSKLNDDNKALIDSEFESDFWQNQSSEALKEAVKSFRRK